MCFIDCLDFVCLCGYLFISFGLIVLVWLSFISCVYCYLSTLGGFGVWAVLVCFGCYVRFCVVVDLLLLLLDRGGLVCCYFLLLFVVLWLFGLLLRFVLHPRWVLMLRWCGFGLLVSVVWFDVVCCRVQFSVVDVVMRVGGLGVDLLLGVCVGLPRGLGCLVVVGWVRFVAICLARWFVVWCLVLVGGVVGVLSIVF